MGFHPRKPACAVSRILDRATILPEARNARPGEECWTPRFICHELETDFIDRMRGACSGLTARALFFKVAVPCSTWLPFRAGNSCTSR